jgi:hypothetical protein
MDAAQIVQRSRYGGLRVIVEPKTARELERQLLIEELRPARKRRRKARPRTGPPPSPKWFRSATVTVDRRKRFSRRVRTAIETFSHDSETTA